MSRIEELKEAYEAATRRDWSVLTTTGLPHVVCLTANEADVMTIAACGTDDNAKFIALSHNLMPRLFKMAELFGKLEEHLDWTGWGDGWERECSEELRKALEEFHGGD